MKEQETIAKLKKDNRKLRIELERVRDKCHEHWEQGLQHQRDRDEAWRNSALWERAHKQLCEAIGKRQ